MNVEIDFAVKNANSDDVCAAEACTSGIGDSNMAIESPSDLTDTLCVEQNMSDGVLIENDRCSMVSKNPIPPGEEGQDSRQASSPTIEHTDSLGSLTLGDTDELTTSTEVIQEDHDRPSKARQKRLELLAKLAANSQPKLGRAASKEIDLSTEEAYEWFEKKFGSIPVQKVTPTSELSQLKELLAKGEITGVYARRKMQETIMKKLSEKRRKEQQKRWETYKADNFIEDEQEEEEEILSDPESELSEEEPEPVEEEEEMDELRKEKEVRKPRCEFLDDEAEESNEESDEPNDIGSGDEEKEDAKETKKLVTGEGGDNVEDGVPKEKGQHDEQPMCMERVESGSLDLVLPNSLSQWVDNGCTQSQCGSKHGTQKSNSSGTVDALGLCSTTFDTATLSSNKVNRSDEDKSRATAVGEVLGRRGSSAEILALCSGQFTGSELIIPQQSSNTARLVLLCL
ncbi:unnamed protein product [Toxocara canis]|uniref:Claspin n=1 Tax=Toxocara canis TaxID=6265 RepID=A0A183V496_TOXCA|nr:unnamed protein product [Toxocara canis]